VKCARRSRQATFPPPSPTLIWTRRTGISLRSRTGRANLGPQPLTPKGMLHGVGSLSNLCLDCGQEVEFKTIEGRAIPFHLPGKPCNPYTDVSCRTAFHTTCRDCRQRCYLVSHNGGYVLLDELGWPWPKHPCFENRFRGVVSKMAIATVVSQMPPAEFRCGKGRRKDIIVAVPPRRELTSLNSSDLIPRMSQPELQKALIDAHKKGDSYLYDLLKDALRERLHSARAAPKPARQEGAREARERYMKRIKGKDW